jgi:hypothetical protein
MLIEIVGNRLNGPKRPRGLVFCDPQGPHGWAVIVVVPDQAKPVPELRVYPRNGLEHVTTARDAFALQIISREQAEKKYADLLPMVLEVLPQASEGVASLLLDHPIIPTESSEPVEPGLVELAPLEGIEEDSSTMPFETPLDDGADEVIEMIEVMDAEPEAAASAPTPTPEARINGIMLEAATMAMTGLAKMKSLWKSMVTDVAVSPRQVAWATGQHHTVAPRSRTGPVPGVAAPKPRGGPVTVEMVKAPAPEPTREPRTVHRPKRRSS